MPQDGVLDWDKGKAKTIKGKPMLVKSSVNSQGGKRDRVEGGKGAESSK